MGAKRATDVYAYGEAVRLLEQALKVQDVLDPEDKARRCDLLLALGDALLLAGDHQRVISTEAPQALSLAEAISDKKRASRACLLAGTGLMAYGTTLVASPEGAQWVSRADRYAEPDTIGRAFADAMLGTLERFRFGSSPEGVALLNRALNLVRRLGDNDTYWAVAPFWLVGAMAPQHDQERLRVAEQLAEESRHGVSCLRLGWVLFAVVNIFLEFGQRRRAEDVMAEMKTLAERTGQPNLLIMCMLHEAIIAIWDGRLEEARAIRRRMLSRGEQLGMLEFAGVWASFILPARVHLGEATRPLESQLRGSRSMPQNVVDDVRILYCLAHLGRCAEATKILEQLVVLRPGIGTGEDETFGFTDIMSLEAALLAGHRRAVELLLCRLSGSSCITGGQWHVTCISRHLGAAAALLGRSEEARKYYQKAIKDCTEMRFRPELALTRLQLAELLLEHYPDEKKEALEHLDFAIREFQDMKMQPSLERALRHKEILKA
jgi:tetratricopeptide (TPR) repeat protein